jgi:hypothetical protein
MYSSDVKVKATSWISTGIILIGTLILQKSLLKLKNNPYYYESEG